MNILYHFRTRGTGAEGVHIAGIARAFGEAGHRVIFSSPTGANPLATAGASPYRDAGRPGLLARLSRGIPGILFELLELGYNIPAFFRNAAMLLREPCGLIYERHAFFLCSTAWLARWRGVPLAVEVNELVGDARVRKQPLLAPLARWCDRVVFRAADVIVVVSPHLKRRIEAAGIRAEKVIVLPNAVTRGDFETPADGGAVRLRLGLGDATVIGFVGWFVEWHRLGMLIRAFAKSSAHLPGAKLLLVGEGALRGSLEEEARGLGILDRIVFAGSVPHSGIPAHIAAMDVCVVPHSNDYRSPIKLFEYMGQGRATVAPRTEPVAMVLSNGTNGMLFDPCSEEQLAGCLSTLASDPELRKRLGQQARLDVLNRHTWTHNADRVFAALTASRTIPR